MAIAGTQLEAAGILRAFADNQWALYTKARCMQSPRKKHERRRYTQTLQKRQGVRDATHADYFGILHADRHSLHQLDESLQGLPHVPAAILGQVAEDAADEWSCGAFHEVPYSVVLNILMYAAKC
jgi:hypothetical protein